ncbi:MAG TPA: Dabb family protein [Bacteroidales bacterium]|nr:Dabb family protein [Bacteroidales bacterium]HRZ48808.1 Dabb family protein [Bacteroidales bacterium]
MLRHVVMFKARPMPAAEKETGILRLKDAIDALQTEVPQVKFLQTGINFNTYPQAFDLVLISDFETEEDLEKYRNHPQHQKVMDVISEFIEKVHVVDFWL